MGLKNDVPQGKWQEIYHELLSLSKENIPPRGALSRASKKHDFSERRRFEVAAYEKRKKAID